MVTGEKCEQNGSQAEKGKRKIAGNMKTDTDIETSGRIIRGIEIE